LKALVEAEQLMEALDQAQEYSKCFPYMKHSTLIFQIAALWELVCAKYQYAKDKCIKKIVAITADSKAEPEVLEAAQAKKEEAGRFCQRANVQLYSLRALKEVYMKKESGEKVVTEREKVTWLNKDDVAAFRSKLEASA